MPQMMPIKWTLVYFMNTTFLLLVIVLINSFYMSHSYNRRLPANPKFNKAFKMEWK